MENRLPKPAAKKSRWWNWKLDSPTPPSQSDPEKCGSSVKKVPRKQILLGPFYAGCGAGLATCEYSCLSPTGSKPNISLDFAGAGVSILLEEYMLDGDATRFAMCLTLPVIVCVSIVRF